jgi:hypothetical protein
VFGGITKTTKSTLNTWLWKNNAEITVHLVLKLALVPVDDTLAHP